MWFTQIDQTYLIYAVAVNVIFMLAMLPDIREVRYHRRQHGKEDMQFAMSQFPMGRSMLRIMKRLKLKKN
jgi:hypothetical protein